jgi:hypothetical protein
VKTALWWIRRDLRLIDSFTNPGTCHRTFKGKRDALLTRITRLPSWIMHGLGKGFCRLMLKPRIDRRIRRNICSNTLQNIYNMV